METEIAPQDLTDFAIEFYRAIALDDDSAARAILESGHPIHIAREDAPAGFAIRVYPDSHEELITVDLEPAAKILGA